MPTVHLHWPAYFVDLDQIGLDSQKTYGCSVAGESFPLVEIHSGQREQVAVWEELKLSEMPAFQGAAVVAGLDFVAQLLPVAGKWQRDSEVAAREDSISEAEDC